MKTKRRLVPKSVGSSSGPLPVEHNVVAQGCGLSTIHSHTPSVRPTVSTLCVRQLDASSDICRLNELKRNVVDQDDHQVNLPSKKTCVCLSNSFPCIHQQSVNPVNVNTSSTPIDDHDDHGHNGLHVGAERILFSDRVTSPDNRLTPTVNTNTSQRRNRQSPTVNLSTSRQQPPSSRPTSDYRYLESCTYSCQHCGALFWGDERLKSVPRSSRPRYNHCCRGGQVVLRTYQMYLEYMKLLLQDRHFLENIRAYNQMFSMTSLGEQVDDSVNNGRGPYVFKISGQLYHWIGSLCPIEGESPSDLRRDIVKGLIDLLDTHNGLVQLFSTTREKFQDIHVPNFKVRLYNVVGTREYELSTGDMLGAIVYETDGYSKDLKMMDPTRSSSDKKRLTMLAFYSYQLHDRANCYNYLSRTGRLFQQYVVTAFCAIEQNRIDYVREHQNDIRSEYLSGIYDAINRGDSDGSDCGIRSVRVSRKEDIDMYVSAELPSKDVDPKCHSIVSEFMMHGPCGLACPSASLTISPIDESLIDFESLSMSMWFMNPTSLKRGCNTDNVPTIRQLALKDKYGFVIHLESRLH
nr:DNA helicase [Tanacetum cinerariifolium]